MILYYYFKEQSFSLKPYKLMISYIYIWEMLTSALKALIKNPIKESFDIIFMGNEKNC